MWESGLIFVPVVYLLLSSCLSLFFELSFLTFSYFSRFCCFFLSLHLLSSCLLSLSFFFKLNLHVFLVCQVWSFHDCENVDGGFLGCDILCTCSWGGDVSDAVLKMALLCSSKPTYKSAQRHRRHIPLMVYKWSWWACVHVCHSKTSNLLHWIMLPRAMTLPCLFKSKHDVSKLSVSFHCTKLAWHLTNTQRLIRQTGISFFPSVSVTALY